MMQDRTLAPQIQLDEGPNAEDAEPFEDVFDKLSSISILDKVNDLSELKKNKQQHPAATSGS